jgi:trimeric autotransporter adhesin
MKLFRLKDGNYTNQKFNRSGLLLVRLVLACMAISPMAQAVLPAPDGGYGPPAYGQNNTAEGEGALLSLTSGTNNTAVGWFSLKTLTTGQYNTAIGAGALSVNTGNLNTATGGAALWSNTSGASNTANGFAALFINTEGDNNTAIGDRALFSNTTGGANTAVGRDALYDNTNGGGHTAVGWSALKNTIASGDFTGNTAVGTLALFNDTTGNGNVAVGWGAGLGLTTGRNNVYLGAGVLAGTAGESNRTYIRNVHDTTSSNRSVYVNPDGRMGTISSSRRYKEEIKPMDQASEVLYRLKPVTYRYKKEIDRTQALSFGLIAEEAAGISPDLITRDREGRPETVRYEAVNAMLLNEFLKEHKKVEEQQANIAALKSTVAQQQKGMEVLTAQLKEQAAQIQKVSAQIEVSKPAPQVVNNP